MKAISDQLHNALLGALLQLPQGQVEQLVLGLRSAVAVPTEVEEQLMQKAKDNTKQQLLAQLAALEQSNGVGDQDVS